MASKPPKFYSDIPRKFCLRCDQHEYYSVSTLPCPWPHCTNGVKENKIIVVERITQKEILYNRTKYLSTDNHERYYWASEELPHCFYSGNLAEGEIWRQTDLYENFAKIIYHYTTINGFHGIVNERNLWLTDHSYLNDSKEIDYGIDIAKGRIAHFITDKGITQKLYSKLKDELLSTEDYRVCIACFSLDGDNLSQWRGYGQHSNGISLGFSVNPAMFGYNQEISISKVVYKPDIQKKIINILLNQYGQAFQRDSKNWQGGSSAIEICTSLMLGRIHRFIISFKDSSFKDEKEVRYFFSENPDFINKGYLQKAKKRFRIVNGILIPYVTTIDLYNNSHDLSAKKEKDPLSPESNFSLQEIIIGPHTQQELVGKGVREFLDYHKLDYVNIKKSAISYRNI